MAVFEIQGPDGVVYEVDAADEATALTAFKNMPKAAPQQQPNIAADVLKSGASGLAQGAIEIPGMIGDAQQLSGSLAGKVAGWLGAGDETQTKVRDIAARYGVLLPGAFGNNAPTSEQLQKGTESVTGEFYKPQTTAGEFAHTVGRFVPSTMLGPGTKAMKFGAGVASGLASEGAGQATKGGPLEPYARIAGAIAGGVPASAAIDFMQAPKIAGQTRTSAALLRGAIPQDTSALGKLGPEAMLLDASPQMTGLAQGVTMAPSRNKDAIAEALLAREKGRSSRLVQDAENTLGKASDPEMLKRRIVDEASADADPYYKQAKRNPPDLRGDEALKSQLAQELTDPAKGMSMGQRGRNKTVFDEIDDALMADSPQETVSRLHSLRQDLDRAINDTMTTSGQQKAVAENARRVVDKILKERVPGFREGDQIYSEGKRAAEAVDYGYNSLEGGKGAVFPETFSASLKTHPKEFVAEGQKSRIASAMGTNSNDLAALKKMVGGDYDFNRAKLAEVFGQDKVDQLVQAIDREGTFSQNYADIARNSQTAQRTAGKQLVDGMTAPQFTGGESVMGLLLKGGAKGVNSVLAKGASKYAGGANEALARALMAKGQDAVDLIERLRATAPKGGKGLQAIIAALNGSRQPAH